MAVFFTNARNQQCWLFPHLLCTVNILKSVPGSFLYVCVHEIRIRGIRLPEWLLQLTYQTLSLKTGLWQITLSLQEEKTHCQDLCQTLPVLCCHWWPNFDRYTAPTVMLVGRWCHILPLSGGSYISVLIAYLFIHNFVLMGHLSFPIPRYLGRESRGNCHAATPRLPTFHLVNFFGSVFA